MAYTTRKSLLRKVRAGDEVGWSEFYETYRPLILRRGMDFHLTGEELAELVQKVMLEFFRKDIFHTQYDIDSVPEHLTFRYEAKQGRFRDFLRRIVTYRAIKLLRSRPRGQVSADELEETLAAETDAVWDEEWRQHMLTQALAELKTRVEAATYQAFEMYALQGRSAAATAAFLEISEAGVYTAKSRCAAKLKEIVKKLEVQE